MMCSKEEMLKHLKFDGRVPEYDGEGQAKSTKWLLREYEYEENPVRRASLRDHIGNRIDRGNEVFFVLRNLGMIE